MRGVPFPTVVVELMVGSSVHGSEMLRWIWTDVKLLEQNDDLFLGDFEERLAEVVVICKKSLGHVGKC